MAKRPDTLETVLLAVELLRRIPRGRKVTASELHRQLKDAGIDRDLRTIQRQLEMLSDHFEIERDDRSKPYGYRWLEQAKALALPNLTPQESLLLQLAEEHLKNLLPARLMKSMEGFFSQAKRNLGPESSARLEREWPGKVRVGFSFVPLKTIWSSWSLATAMSTRRSLFKSPSAIAFPAGRLTARLVCTN